MWRIKRRISYKPDGEHTYTFANDDSTKQLWIKLHKELADDLIIGQPRPWWAIEGAEWTKKFGDSQLIIYCSYYDGGAASLDLIYPDQFFPDHITLTLESDDFPRINMYKVIDQPNGKLDLSHAQIVNSNNPEITPNDLSFLKENGKTVENFIEDILHDPRFAKTLLNDIKECWELFKQDVQNEININFV